MKDIDSEPWTSGRDEKQSSLSHDDKIVFNFFFFGINQFSIVGGSEKKISRRPGTAVPRMSMERMSMRSGLT
jgi:hypothetical protein